MKGKLFLLAVCLSMLIPAMAQRASQNLPPAYQALSSDTARMRWLMKAINDSLDNDQLTPVYDWARKGLAMAESNGVDTMKGIFNFFIGKAFTYKLLRPDSAVVYYKRVLPYFPDRRRKYNVFSVRELMDRYCEMGNKDSSSRYLDSLKAFIDTMPDTSPKKISLSTNIATVYQWLGMYKSAIRSYYVAINGNRKNGNLLGLGMALANLGELYNESEDLPKAIAYSKEALGYLADVNMPFMNTASNLAAYYTAAEKFDSALFYLEQSEKVAMKLDDSAQIYTNRYLRAGIYIGQKKFHAARVMLADNIARLHPEDNWFNLCQTYLSLGALDTTVHAYGQAKESLVKALAMARHSQHSGLIILALSNLSDVSARLKDYKEAYEYQQELLLRKDSLANEKTKVSLADMEVNYQTQQKEEQIRLLQQDNDIKNLQLQSNRRSLVIYILIFAMVSIILGIVFYQRNLRNKIKAEKIKSELETKVLRLQMNPHFIFNSLNSIENFIMRNEKRPAIDYLNKFARLIRMILDSSQSEVVPIDKDMEALQLYVDLEQLRFAHKFSYKATIDPALLGGDYRAPALLIQPYVENAIVHGLANSDEDGLYLAVTATLEDDKIKYVIQDNGVGREKSKEYNQKNKPYHRSMGLAITEDRIQLFNNEKEGAVMITDLYHADKSAGGTKVEITLNAV
jgi:tetratricopeptide (TPR) repeat protein